jgi:putative glutamine amidotransferase
MTPRIAIPLPTSFDLEYNRQNYASYADAVTASGGEPVPVPLEMEPGELARLAASCDGILLPGSPADVDPAKYGQDRDEATAQADPAREEVDEFLLADAFRLGKPVLGICFGTQMLNVFRGGTLVQDLMVLPVNHPAGRAVMVAHSAAIAPGSLLAASIDSSEASQVDEFLRLPVNSSHHQAVGIAGAGLQVSARCPQDGVVEAIEMAAAEAPFALGVQWHPERTFATSASSRSLFARFLHAAATRPVAVR